MKLFILLVCSCVVAPIAFASNIAIEPETLLTLTLAPAIVAESPTGVRTASDVQLAAVFNDLTIAESLSMPDVEKASTSVAALTPEPSASLIFAAGILVLSLARRKSA